MKWTFDKGVKMRKLLCLIFIVTLLVPVGEFTALRAESISKQESVQGETTLDVLFNVVLIYLKDGSRLSGLLVGIEGDVLIVRIGGKDERIQSRNITKIIIKREKKLSRYVVSGMLLGIYVGNLALLRAKNQPTFYMEDKGSELWLLMWNAIFAAAGGGLGILGSSALEKGEEVFDFTGNMDKRYREWERLHRFVIGDIPVQKKIHFRIQAGKVFPRVSNRYRDLLIDNDYYVSRYGWLDNQEWEEASDINLLRKVQLTYFLNNFIEVGVASVWLGEPSIQGNKWGYGGEHIWQKLAANGLYAVGAFKPFSKGVPKGISWEFGAGAGAAIINFNLTARSTTWYPTTTEETFEHSISKTLFSGIVFTELSFYLYDSLSLGLIADYTYIPEQEVPAVPLANLSAQRLRFGNSNIGISLGFHF